MKFIAKHREPHELKKWKCDQTKIGVNRDYNDMPTDVKNKVRDCLLSEQGYLCCYTGAPITIETSHIEHIKPQTCCENGEDVKYTNLLAAYPGPGIQAEYGAHAKADWYDQGLFISPLYQGCETRFTFTLYGQIQPTNQSDNAAIETIKRLKLDHEKLIEHRRNAINETLFQYPKSAKQLAHIIAHYGKKDGNGHYHSYCFVIQQAAQIMLNRSRRHQATQQRIRNEHHDRNR